MTNTLENNTCELSEDGRHCAMHNVEVERRKNTTRGLKALEDKIEANSVQINRLTNFKHAVYAVTLLGVVILLGNYYYTDSHIKESNGRLDKIESAATNRQTQISDLKLMTAITEERYKSLTIQLSSLNSNMTELLKTIHNKYGISPKEGIE